MRSRVVPMRDMREKFGAEVKSFPYAFVIETHFPGWDSPAQERSPVPVDSMRMPAFPALSAGKTPKYIEVKPRP